MSDILVTKDGPIVTLTINRPDVHNALSGNSTIDEIAAACTDIEHDPSTRVVIVTGAGSSFSSGGNVKAFADQHHGKKQGTAIREELRDGIQRLPKALYNLEVPTIAAINGPAIGGGLDLALMCDIRIASERARFAANFVRVGLVPALGGGWFLPRVVGISQASQMCFTGEVLNAERALSIGLVSEVVAPDKLLSRAQELAEQIASSPARAVRMTKQLLREGAKTGLNTNLELAAAFQALGHHTPDHEEAVTAYVAKRAPAFNQ